MKIFSSTELKKFHFGHLLIVTNKKNIYLNFHFMFSSLRIRRDRLKVIYLAFHKEKQSKQLKKERLIFLLLLSQNKVFALACERNSETPHFHFHFLFLYFIDFIVIYLIIVSHPDSLRGAHIEEMTRMLMMTTTMIAHSVHMLWIHCYQ